MGDILAWAWLIALSVAAIIVFFRLNADIRRGIALGVGFGVLCAAVGAATGIALTEVLT